MKKEITMLEYPYNLSTFGRNVKDYGLTSSLKHDLEKTKKDVNDGLAFIIAGAFYGVMVAAAIPIMIYNSYKVVKKDLKEKKKMAVTGGEK